MRTTADSPLQPLFCRVDHTPSTTPPSISSVAPHHRSSPLNAQHHGQPALASLLLSRPHPEHDATEYFLPSCFDPAGDPYSGLPTSIPHHLSPPLWTSLLGELLPPRHPKTSPPPYRLAPRTLPATPRHRRHGSKLPCLSVLGQMAKWAGNP
jgi:hypothetical protein